MIPNIASHSAYNASCNPDTGVVGDGAAAAAVPKVPKRNRKGNAAAACCRKLAALFANKKKAALQELPTAAAVPATEASAASMPADRCGGRQGSCGGPRPLFCMIHMHHGR